MGGGADVTLMPVTHQTRVDSKLDRCTYEVGPVIGKGNDGQVVRAVNMESGKRVAIKIMRRRYNQDDGMSEVGEIAYEGFI